jgi:hypothetical protein
MSRLTIKSHQIAKRKKRDEFVLPFSLGNPQPGIQKGSIHRKVESTTSRDR